MEGFEQLLQGGIGPVTAVIGILLAYGKLRKSQEEERARILKEAKVYTDKEVAHLKELYTTEFLAIEKKLDEVNAKLDKLIIRMVNSGNS